MTGANPPRGTGEFCLSSDKCRMQGIGGPAPPSFPRSPGRIPGQPPSFFSLRRARPRSFKERRRHYLRTWFSQVKVPHKLLVFSSLRATYTQFYSRLVHDKTPSAPTQRLACSGADYADRFRCALLVCAEEKYPAGRAVAGFSGSVGASCRCSPSGGRSNVFGCMATPQFVRAPV